MNLFRFFFILASFCRSKCFLFCIRKILKNIFSILFKDILEYSNVNFYLLKNPILQWWVDDIQRGGLKSQLIVCILLGRRSNLSRRTSAVFQIYLASHRIQSTTARETTTCGLTFRETLGTLVPRILWAHATRTSDVHHRKSIPRNWPIQFT